MRGISRAPGLRRSAATRIKADLWARWGWLWRPALYTAMVVGFLLGRAVPGVSGAPLGLAFFTAVRAAGASVPVTLSVAVAVVLGCWTVVGESAAYPFAAIVGLILAHLLFAALRLGSRGPSPLGAAAVGGISALIPSIVAQVGTETDHLAVVHVLFLAGLVSVLSLVFCQGAAEVLTGRALYRQRTDVPFSAIALAAATLCGVVGLPPLYEIVMPWEFAASLLVMIGAYAGGWTAGAATGGIIGLSYVVGVGAVATGRPDSVVSLGDAAIYTMGYLLAGMLAGAFRELRWLGVAISFSLTILIFFSVAAQDADHLMKLLVTVAAASLVLLLLPRRWLANVPAAFLGTDAADPAEMAESQRSPSGRVADRIRGLAKVLREVLRAFEQVAAISQPVSEPAGSAGRAVDQTADRVCKTCSMYSHCWQEEAPRTRQALGDLWTSLQSNGGLSAEKSTAELGHFCIYPKEIVCTLDYLHDLDRTHRYWERRFEEGRAVVGEHLRNVSQILDRLGEEVSSGARSAVDEARPAIRVQSGVARLARKGNRVSGDSYAGEQVDPVQFLLVLSDGMGGGQRAALESKQCVSLLRQLIGAGFSTEVAMQTVNSALLLRSPEDSFTTVDLILVNLQTGRAEFIKVGAPPSFLIRGDDVTVIRSEGVPIGIIDRVQMEPEFRLLRPGDVIVMVTDGLWDIARDEADKERWLIDHLRRTRMTDPAELAESVLARALELTDRDGADDMTVLVAAVGESESMTAQGPTRRSDPVQWAIAKLAPKRRAEGKE